MAHNQAHTNVTGLAFQGKVIFRIIVPGGAGFKTLSFDKHI
jgi:hypothetical protein